MKQILIDLIPAYSEVCQRFVSGDGSGVVVELLASDNKTEMNHPESFLVVFRNNDEVDEIVRHARARDAVECFVDFVSAETLAYFDPSLV